MSSPYQLAKGLWRALPRPIRKTISAVPPVQWAKRRLINATIHTADHQDIYDEAYYANRSADQSAEVMASSVVRDLAPKRVIDVGCGTGDLLNHLGRHGVTGRGLEYSVAALKVCRERGLDVDQFDLEQDVASDLGRFDVAVSMEVAEHLPEPCADRYVDLLCSVSDTVAFTAATPGQGGTDHVNEQPHEYWLDKFAARGFGFDESLSQAWRAEWAERETAPWYYKNIMVVRRR